jgi:hypothetical protein
MRLRLVFRIRPKTSYDFGQMALLLRRNLAEDNTDGPPIPDIDDFDE